MESSIGTGGLSAYGMTRTARLGALVVAGFALIALPAHAAAQSIDSTVEQQVETDLTDTLDEELEDQVEGDLEEIVEEQVEADVAGTVEDEVQAQVESDVAGGVEEQVQGQVEADVTGTIEEQVESGVGSTVEHHVESGIVDAVEQELEDTVAQTVEDGITANVRETIEQALGDEVGDELGELVEQLADLVEELGIENVEEAIETAAGRTRPIAGDEARPGDTGGGNAGHQRYAAGMDESGRAAEKNVWVILVPDRYKGRILGWGFTIREERELAALDRVLLRVDAPANRDIGKAALELALAAPGTSVDFNHVYEPTQAHDEGAGGAVARSEQGAGGRDATLEIGIIDSKVALDHEAIARADIVQQDFVPFAAARPTGHGTAIASILVGDSAARRGVLAGGRLHAASVFFEDERGNEIATAASLVDALDWLGADGVGVVNMSLTGPPNRVLEAAIEVATNRGAVIVAAVGNNGPSGEPLFPAAYEQVVGITAVDASNRVYRYANRGRHVMFAALGVDVTIAQSSGGYATQSGTSMAAPYAAATIVTSLAAQAASPERVLASLQAAAIDLGEQDFDEIYGFGLIPALD